MTELDQANISYHKTASAPSLKSCFNIESMRGMNNVKAS